MEVLLLLVLAFVGPDDYDAIALLKLASASKQAGIAQAQNKVPPIEAAVELSSDDKAYAKAHEEAKKADRWLVVYVGVPVRQIDKTVAVRVESINDSKEKRIFFCKISEGRGDSVPHTITTEQLQQMMGILPRLVVSPEANRFTNRPSSSDPLTADGDPWLSREEEDEVEAAWPKGVAKIAGMRSYSLAPLYQNMWTMNGGRSRFNVPTSIVGLEPSELSVSGGMVGVHGFRSVKRLAIPKGRRILVWKEDTDVRAFSLVPRWRWKFPEGTVAADVLFNRRGRIFTIRTQTKSDDEWMTKVLFNDEKEYPEGYAGLQQSCTSCHSKVAVLRTVPGHDYLHATWGDDGRYSWRPFDESGNLDTRWPIEQK